MSSSPFFSIVLPTHNRADLLPRAISSVLDQTFPDFELIVVDDASTDQSWESVKSFRDERVIYLKLPENRGPGAARNVGIRQAKGVYISFLDDDDEYLPDLLAEVYQAFETAPEQIGFLGCGIRVIEQRASGKAVVREHIPPKPHFASQEEAYLACLKRLPFGSGWGMTVKPTCFDTVGLFDESLGSDVDRDLIIRLVRHYDYGVIRKILVSVHRHGGPKLSTYGTAKAMAHEAIMRKNLEALCNHPRLWALWNYKIGWLHYHSGNRVRGRQFMMQGLRHYPWHLKSWLGLVILELFGSQGPHLHRRLSQMASAAKGIWLSGASRVENTSDAEEPRTKESGS